MDVNVCCCDGTFTCDRDVIQKHSKMLQEHFSETCRCISSVIIPDLAMGVVSLAIGLLDMTTGAESAVELEKELLETVDPVFSLLQILCVSPRVKDVLNPDTGDIEVCNNQNLRNELYCCCSGILAVQPKLKLYTSTSTPTVQIRVSK